MTIRELSEIQEGLKTIELTGNEAKAASARLQRIIKYTDQKDIIYAGEQRGSIQSTITYHIINSTVFFNIQHSRDYDYVTNNHVSSVNIGIASPNPDYREESLSKLEQIMEMRLREGRRPAVITA